MNRYNAKIDIHRTTPAAVRHSIEQMENWRLSLHAEYIILISFSLVLTILALYRRYRVGQRLGRDAPAKGEASATDSGRSDFCRL
jgi:hypothetical protein